MNDYQTPVRTTSKAKPPTNWWRELRSILVLILLVLGIHSFIAKPFYIPSISMMPSLLVGDRLVVSKWPYGYSFASISFHLMPPIEGRVFGRTPERGDIVILEPPGNRIDYIKRVIGLPGERFEVRNGTVFINGRAVKREVQPMLALPVDENSPCSPLDFPGALVTGANGVRVCELPIVRETLPNGVSFDTIELGSFEGDNVPALTIPAGHVFLMGDNRDRSADSRFPSGAPINGLGGPVPLEHIGGRAELITFSVDGSTRFADPSTWLDALRGDRAGLTLRAHPDTRPAKQR